MPFTSDLVVEELKRPGWWQLVEDLVYKGRDDTFTVPAGFTTDFASVPQLFLWLVPRSGKYTKAAVLHDYLSRELVPAGGISRCDADGLFRRTMRDLGVSALRRWLMWTAVRFSSPLKLNDCGIPLMLAAIGLLLFMLPIAVPIGVLLLLVLLFVWVVEWIVYLALLPTMRVKNRPSLIWWSS